MRRELVLLLGIGLLAAPLAGCLGFLGAEDDTSEDTGDDDIGRLVDNRTRERIENRLSSVPANYTFPGQQDLPSVTHYFNGTATSEANLGVEDRNDRAGNSYNTLKVTTDVSSYVPVGQPTEMHITLYYYNQGGNSAKCDVLVDVPGTKTSWNPTNNDEFNWKFSVQRTVVNTVGVAGATHEVGVECSNGRMTSGVPFTIRIDFSYERDVLTPHFPYAFQVPANASGVIFESAKAGGPEHLRAWFMVVGPNDELVAFVDFNDIAIPTESVFVATPEPGEYVFYSHNMTGGFLRLRADAPVDDREVRVLELKEERVVDATGPTPGAAERDWLHDGTVVTPAGGGQESTFNVDGAFPLRISAFIGDEGGSSSTLMSDIRISSPKGLVASLQRVLRHDDERGSLGVSQDTWNKDFQPMNLAKGVYTVQVVNDSPNAALGHVITTYVR